MAVQNTNFVEIAMWLFRYVHANSNGSGTQFYGGPGERDLNLLEYYH